VDQKRPPLQSITYMAGLISCQLDQIIVAYASPVVKQKIQENREPLNSSVTRNQATLGRATAPKFWVASPLQLDETGPPLMLTKDTGFIGSWVYSKLMRWRPMRPFIISGAIYLMASPIRTLAQCPKPGYVHFLFRPDHPVRHIVADDVTVEGAPDLEGLTSTNVERWLERNPSEEAGETDVTIQVEPERLAAQRAEMEERLRRDAAGSDSRWVEALGESVKDVLQDNGYFRAEVSVEKIVLSSDADQDHASLDIHISEGKQYRLGDIQFNGAHVFPPWQLRNQIPLRDGAIFELDKLREGVRNLDRMYDLLGYINFTASPDVKIDEADQRASVTFEVDEDRRFTIGRVEVLGLPDAATNELKVRLKTGDPFNPELVDEFYRENRTVLPPNASKENTELTQNAQHNTVDVVFDFRFCP